MCDKIIFPSTSNSSRISEFTKWLISVPGNDKIQKVRKIRAQLQTLGLESDAIRHAVKQLNLDLKLDVPKLTELEIEWHKKRLRQRACRSRKQTKKDDKVETSLAENIERLNLSDNSLTEQPLKRRRRLLSELSTSSSGSKGDETGNVEKDDSFVNNESEPVTVQISSTETCQLIESDSICSSGTDKVPSNGKLNQSDEICSSEADKVSCNDPTEHSSSELLAQCASPTVKIDLKRKDLLQGDASGSAISASLALSDKTQEKFSKVQSDTLESLTSKESSMKNESHISRELDSNDDDSDQEVPFKRRRFKMISSSSDSEIDETDNVGKDSSLSIDRTRVLDQPKVQFDGNHPAGTCSTLNGVISPVNHGTAKVIEHDQEDRTRVQNVQVKSSFETDKAPSNSPMEHNSPKILHDNSSRLVDLQNESNSRSGIYVSLPLSHLCTVEENVAILQNNPLRKRTSSESSLKIILEKYCNGFRTKSTDCNENTDNTKCDANKINSTALKLSSSHEKVGKNGEKYVKSLKSSEGSGEVHRETKKTESRSASTDAKKEVQALPKKLPHKRKSSERRSSSSSQTTKEVKTSRRESVEQKTSISSGKDMKPCKESISLKSETFQKSETKPSKLPKSEHKSKDTSSVDCTEVCSQSATQVVGNTGSCSALNYVINPVANTNRSGMLVSVDLPAVPKTEDNSSNRSKSSRKSVDCNEVKEKTENSKCDMNKPNTPVLKQSSDYKRISNTREKDVNSLKKCKESISAVKESRRNLKGSQVHHGTETRGASTESGLTLKKSAEERPLPKILSNKRKSLEKSGSSQALEEDKPSHRKSVEHKTSNSSAKETSIETKGQATVETGSSNKTHIRSHKGSTESSSESKKGVGKSAVDILGKGSSRKTSPSEQMISSPPRKKSTDFKSASVSGRRDSMKKQKHTFENNVTSLEEVPLSLRISQNQNVAKKSWHVEEESPAESILTSIDSQNRGTVVTTHTLCSRKDSEFSLESKKSSGGSTEDILRKTSVRKPIHVTSKTSNQHVSKNSLSGREENVSVEESKKTKSVLVGISVPRDSGPQEIENNLASKAPKQQILKNPFSVQEEYVSVEESKRMKQIVLVGITVPRDCGPQEIEDNLASKGPNQQISKNLSLQEENVSVGESKRTKQVVLLGITVPKDFGPQEIENNLDPVEGGDENSCSEISTTIKDVDCSPNHFFCDSNMNMNNMRFCKSSDSNSEDKKGEGKSVGILEKGSVGKELRRTTDEAASVVLPGNCTRPKKLFQGNNCSEDIVPKQQALRKSWRVEDKDKSLEENAIPAKSKRRKQRVSVCTTSISIDSGHQGIENNLDGRDSIVGQDKDSCSEVTTTINNDNCSQHHLLCDKRKKSTNKLKINKKICKNNRNNMKEKKLIWQIKKSDALKIDWKLYQQEYMESAKRLSKARSIELFGEDVNSEVSPQSSSPVPSILNKLVLDSSVPGNTSIGEWSADNLPDVVSWDLLSDQSALIDRLFPGPTLEPTEKSSSGISMTKSALEFSGKTVSSSVSANSRESVISNISDDNPSLRKYSGVSVQSTDQVQGVTQSAEELVESSTASTLEPPEKSSSEISMTRSALELSRKTVTSSVPDHDAVHRNDVELPGEQLSSKDSLIRSNIPDDYNAFPRNNCGISMPSIDHSLDVNQCAEGLVESSTASTLEPPEKSSSHISMTRCSLDLSGKVVTSSVSHHNTVPRNGAEKLPGEQPSSIESAIRSYVIPDDTLLRNDSRVSVPSTYQATDVTQSTEGLVESSTASTLEHPEKSSSGISCTAPTTLPNIRVKNFANCNFSESARCELTEEEICEIIDKDVKNMEQHLHLAVVDYNKMSNSSLDASRCSENLAREESKRAKCEYNRSLRIRSAEFTPVFLQLIKKTSPLNPDTVFLIYCKLLESVLSYRMYDFGQCFVVRDVICNMLKENGVVDKIVSDTLHTNYDEFKDKIGKIARKHNMSNIKSCMEDGLARFTARACIKSEVVTLSDSSDDESEVTNNENTTASKDPVEENLEQRVRGEKPKLIPFKTPPVVTAEPVHTIVATSCSFNLNLANVAPVVGLENVENQPNDTQLSYSVEVSNVQQQYMNSNQRLENQIPDSDHSSGSVVIPVESRPNIAADQEGLECITSVDTVTLNNQNTNAPLISIDPEQTTLNCPTASPPSYLGQDHNYRPYNTANNTLLNFSEFSNVPGSQPAVHYSRDQVFQRQASLPVGTGIQSKSLQNGIHNRRSSIEILSQLLTNNQSCAFPPQVPDKNQGQAQYPVQIQVQRNQTCGFSQVPDKNHGHIAPQNPAQVQRNLQRQGSQQNQILRKNTGGFSQPSWNVQGSLQNPRNQTGALHQGPLLNQVGSVQNQVVGNQTSALHQVQGQHTVPNRALGSAQNQAKFHHIRRQEQNVQTQARINQAGISHQGKQILHRQSSLPSQLVAGVYNMYTAHGHVSSRAEYNLQLEKHIANTQINTHLNNLRKSSGALQSSCQPETRSYSATQECTQNNYDMDSHMGNRTQMIHCGTNSLENVFSGTTSNSRQNLDQLVSSYDINYPFPQATELTRPPEQQQSQYSLAALNAFNTRSWNNLNM